MIQDYKPMNYIGTKTVYAEPCKAWKNSGNHKIGDDGYKVMYPDGYISWSPKNVFEQAYHGFTEMTFGDAIELMDKEKARVQRKGWNGKGMWLAIQKPNEHSKMTAPYIYMKTADDKMVPWLASQTDMLAKDWQLYQELTGDTCGENYEISFQGHTVVAALSEDDAIKKFHKDYKIDDCSTEILDIDSY